MQGEVWMQGGFGCKKGVTLLCLLWKLSQVMIFQSQEEREVFDGNKKSPKVF